VSGRVVPQAGPPGDHGTVSVDGMLLEGAHIIFDD